MLELLTNYSGSEILIFIVSLAIAIRGIVVFCDWAVDRLRKIFKEESAQEVQISTIQERLARGNENFEILSQNQKKFEKTLSEIMDRINLLVESDKDDIKSFITKEHHYYCYEKGWIDDYSLDCLERRYNHYKIEGGNSYIGELMEELRELSKNPPNKE